MNFRCGPCKKSFKTGRALEQHQSDSPSFNCDDCNRPFHKKQFLQQHIQTSSAHNPSLNSQTSRQQHKRTSSALTPSKNRKASNRSRDTKKSLEYHLEGSVAQQDDSETPLDIFFRSFSTFDYNPSLPPATSFAKLRRHEGFQRGSTESDEAWEAYQDALQDELKMWYGSESDLAAWHALCRALGIKPLPKTCERCEEATRKIHVNIVDLIEWRRNGSLETPRLFGDVKELREYSRETGKIFSIRFAQENDNVVLRHLLRKIF